MNGTINNLESLYDGGNFDKPFHKWRMVEKNIKSSFDQYKWDISSLKIQK